MKREQEFYRCANYKDGRGSCRVHYIRNVVLEEIVLESISAFADFARCYEPVFLYMAAKKNAALKQNRRRELQRDIAKSEKRIKIICRLIEKLYEVHDNNQRYGRGRVKVDIYFTAVGLMDIPAEKEILAVMAEMQSSNAAKQISA